MAGKSYDVTTKLMLNDGMSKGLKKVLDHVNKVNTALERMSGLGDGLDNVYRGTVDMATGANVANEAFKKLDTTMKSVSGTKIPSMAPKITGSATVPLSAGSGLEKSVGVMGKLKSGYQKLVDYSAQLDKNSIGFFRNLRYSMLNTYILIQGLKSVGRVLSGILESSDAYVNSLSRLNLANSMLNDGLFTTRELQNEIHEAAQRSRIAYGDMADFVSDMTLQAGHAFKNQKEILKFSELIQKSFKAAGTSIQSQVAGLYQLKQALASNRLQGDEFRSIIENMPQLTNMLNASLGTTHEQLKKMSSEGALTAEVIKQAIFDSEELIEQMFRAMPKTFGDVMTHLKNEWGKGLWEMKERFNIFLNSALGTELIDELTRKLKRLGEILTNMMHYLPMVVEWLRKMSSVIKDNSGIILMAIGALMLQRSLMEIVNSAVKIVTIFGKFSWIVVIMWAIALAIGFWIKNMHDVGYTWTDIANAIIDKINAIYQFLQPLINLFIKLVEVIIWLKDWIIGAFQSLIEMLQNTTTRVLVLGAAFLVMAALAFVALHPVIATILVVIAVVVALIWVISKIGPTIGRAVGTAIGFFIALKNIVDALKAFIPAAFEHIKAQIVGSITVAIGKIIVSLGKFVNEAQSAGNALGKMMVAGANIAIGGINKLIAALNKIPNVNIDAAGFASYTGITGEGNELISLGYSIQSEGLSAMYDAKSAYDSAGQDFQDALTGFGDTINMYADLGEQIGSNMQDWASDFLSVSDNKLLNNIVDSDLGKFSLLDPWLLDLLQDQGGGDSDGAGGGSGGGGGGGSGGKQNIGTVDKVNEVDLSDSTMKLLKAMYERDLFQRFVNIDSSMQFSFVGTADKEEKAEDIAANVDKIVAERLANLLIT